MQFDATDLEVSPQASALIHLVPGLSEETLRNVERLLVADLAAPTSAELREARLGLLIEMVSDGTGEIPRAEDYDALRAEREVLGEKWPHSTTLSRGYSDSWPLAVRAAMRLAFDGPTSRVAHTHTRRGSHSPYRREEVIAALLRFRDEHSGRWPSASQFFDWGESLRRAARTGGLEDPRIPTQKALRRHFKRFSLAITAAQLAAEVGTTR
jgi:hypothetical protein